MTTRSLKAPPSAPREVLAAGNYPARLVHIIQIGTVMKSFKNSTPKETPLLYLGFELPTEVDPYDEDGGPLIKYQEYTFSMGKKANLRKDIASWFGKDFKNQDEANAFELLTLLNRTCQVNITHSEKADDASVIYANIENITPLAKGMVCPERITELNSLLYSDFDWDFFNSIPEYWQDKVKKSLEFAELPAPGTKAATSNSSANASLNNEEKGDLPF